MELTVAKQKRQMEFAVRSALMRWTKTFRVSDGAMAFPFCLLRMG